MPFKVLAPLLFAIGLFLAPSSVDAAPAEKRVRGMTYNGTSTQDLSDLRALGANVIVYQLTIDAPVVDAASVSEYRALLDAELAAIDPLVELCGQNGMKMILLLSSPPGGAVQGSTPPKHKIFSDKTFQDEMFITWQTIANRYVGKSGIYAFDLLNEPQETSVAPGVLKWKQLAAQLVSTIRTIDPTRRIMIQPPYGNADLIRTRVPLLRDPLIIYNVHSYFPSNFRNQGLGGRPINVIYPKGKLNKARLRQSLEKVIRFQAKSKVKIFVGEFAAPRWAPKSGALKYIRDSISIFESQRWGWALHAWREADVWSIEHTEDPSNLNPSPTKTDRQILLEKSFRKNKF